jgi:manganese/zinc/iron transport system ATP- binding protein
VVVAEEERTFASQSGVRPLANLVSTGAAVVAEDLWARYPGAETAALRGVSVSIPRGARVALVGPNGAGKSTLLKAAVGLVPITQGRLNLLGGTFRGHRRRVAYLPQVGEIDWRFPVTVRRMVLTGRYVHLGWLRRPGRRDREQADAMLDRLGIADLDNRQIGQLSGGQRQRVLLARALAQEADLLLLDEPFNAVDEASRNVIRRMLDDLRDEGRTVVFATHGLDVEADGIVYLSQGRRVAEPDPGEGQHVETPWH